MSAIPQQSIDALAAALRLVAGRDLWGYLEIAAYSKYEYNYVVNVITAQPGFPRPIRAVAPKSQPRYIAGEVMAWFESRQES